MTESATEVANGRWARGKSGNPNGRPPGSRNRRSQWLLQLVTQDAQRVVAAVVKAATGGDMGAAKLVLDRVLPLRACTPVSAVALPPLRTAADAALAAGEVAGAALDGRITAADAASLAHVIEAFRRTLVATEIEQRVEELEARIKGQV